MGGRYRIRTYDFHRVNLNVLGFSTTYKTAGTAKIRGSRTRHRILWVGLWSWNFHNGASSQGRTLTAVLRDTNLSGVVEE